MRLPHVCAREGAQVAVHRPPGRERRRWRQVAPLATGAHEVEQAVQQPPHVGRARPAAGLGGRDQGRDQRVLLVAERLPGAEIADQRPALRCPHGVPPRRAAPHLNRRQRPLRPMPALMREHGANLTCSGTAIIVTANNVNLVLAGHTLTAATRRGRGRQRAEHHGPEDHRRHHRRIQFRHRLDNTPNARVAGVTATGGSDRHLRREHHGRPARRQHGHEQLSLAGLYSARPRAPCSPATRPRTTGRPG